MAEARHRGAPERFGGPAEPIVGAARGRDPDRLRRLARELAVLGLNERAVKSCFAVGCVAHALMRRPAPAPMAWPPATVLPYLFVAGHAAPAEIARLRLAGAFDELVALGLIREDHEEVRATVALLPVGEALAVCGPLPDDSTFHLIGSLPRRRVEAWLDVGTGNAIVPLARRGLAPRVLASDIDADAIAFARAGVALNAASEITTRHCNLLEATTALEKWPLITFNAPIPTGDDDRLLDRFWNQVRDAVADNGEVIVHSQQPARGYPDCLDLPGLTVALRYTPQDVTPAFGVTFWRPSGSARRELIAVELTAEEPHVARERYALDD